LCDLGYEVWQCQRKGNFFCTISFTKNTVYRTIRRTRDSSDIQPNRSPYTSKENIHFAIPTIFHERIHTVRITPTSLLFPTISSHRHIRGQSQDGLCKSYY